ncbi:uncharacterized protein CEXT_45661 [Caerostris extrusa]|uniref:Uncharacterized protein n=1 Tax=Caerostris extrusa TaxID=172846 RepID=A0AAV4MGJ5_CAEEX|nr:uncharacterized protein CEXT_45661 [Caerostris extrusa]
MATEIPSLVPSFVKAYFKKSWYESMDQHSTIACLADQYGIFGSRAQFGYKGINWDVIYEFPDSDIVRISTSCHCKEVTYGPTRYCRGEFVLVHKKCVTFLRSGLPTLATTPSNVKTFDYITVTPKYDGSLISTLFVPVHSIPLLKDLFEDEPVYTHPYANFKLRNNK